VLQLDGDDLRRAQPQPRDEQQHGVVAATESIVRTDCVDQSLNLFRLQVSRQAAGLRLRNARNAVCQVPRRLAAPEQELEQVTQMGRRGLVSACSQLCEEGDDVVWLDGVEIAEGPAEAERH